MIWSIIYSQSQISCNILTISNHYYESNIYHNRITLYTILINLIHNNLNIIFYFKLHLLVFNPIPYFIYFYFYFYFYFILLQITYFIFYSFYKHINLYFIFDIFFIFINIFLKFVFEIYFYICFYHYQLLFLISASLYNSIDYYFSFYSAQPQYYLFYFRILDSINFGIALSLCTIISLVLSFTVLFQTLINKNANYSYQVIQKIIFPIQAYLFIKLHTNSNILPQVNIINSLIPSLFLFSILLVVIIIIVFNLKLNIRYDQNKDKGFYRLFKYSYLFLLTKIIINIIATLLYPNSTSLYLAVICCINLISNITFIFKTYYENPKYEYLQTLTQIYIWIPILIKILNYTDSNQVASQIVGSLAFFMYLTIGILKPKILLNLLQSKYQICINKFEQLQNGNTNTIIGFNSQNDITLCYLSITLNIYFNTQKDLRWSQQFKTKVIQSLAFNIIHKQQKLLQSKKLSYRVSPSIIQSNLQNSLLIPKQPSYSQPYQINPQYFKQINIYSDKSSNYFYSQLWSFLNSFISSISDPSKCLLLLCYNLLDTTNLMKQQLFYLHFLNEKRAKGYFEKIDSKLCFSQLIKKVGRQGNNKEQHQKGLKFTKNNKKPESELQTQSQAFQKNNNSNQSCIIISRPFFKTQYNKFIQQNSLYLQILQDLESFATNQQLYSSINSTQQSKEDKILKYFKTRNYLRHTIQNQITQYTSLHKGFSKIYVSSMLNYIKDYWINHNSLIAIQNFQKTLEQALIWKKTSKLTSLDEMLKAEYNLKNDKKKLICFISAVSKPNNVMVCCSEFKRSLELGDQASFLLSNTQQISTLANQNSHQINYHDLMLPIFRDQHQKLISQFYESPISHQSKVSFLLSKKKSTILQVKFKMFFHMMYEKDLLIILDITSQKIKHLIITEKNRNNILFHHVQKNISATFKKLSKYQQKCKQYANKQFTSLKGNNHSFSEDSLYQGMQTQQVCLFNKQYKISVIREQKIIPTNIFQSIHKQQKNPQTQIQFHMKCEHREVEFLQKQRNLRQLKFSNYKQKFSEGQTEIPIMVMYKILSIIVTILGLIILINQEQNSLKTMMYIIRDKIQIQEDYAKDNFNRPVDSGMLDIFYYDEINNVYDKHQEQDLLFQHIYNSLENSISSMKDRHHFNPYLVDKSIKTNNYWRPDWINSYNISFEMMTYKTQMKFLEYARKYIKIVELSQQNLTLSFTAGPIKVILNTQHLSFQLEFIWGYDYLQRLITDQVYLLESQNGVLAKFSQDEAQIFKQLQDLQMTLIIFIQIALFIISCVKISIVYKIVKQMVRKYNISNKTSNKFRYQFSNQTKELKKCIEEMKYFEKELINKVIKPKQFNYQQIQQRKQYTVIKYATNQNINQNYKEKQQNDNIFDPSNISTNDQFHNKLMNNDLQFRSYKFSFMKFPVFIAIIVFIIFGRVNSNYSQKIKHIKTFSKGLQDLTSINIQILNLMALDLYVTTIQALPMPPEEKSASMNLLISQFKYNISQASKANKINIITQLFLEEDQVLNKVLYQNLCKIYKSEMQCPEYMLSKIDSLSQKYSQTMKSINILFLKLTNSPNRDIFGHLNTTSYRSRYIQSYQNINQLLYLSEKVRKMSFNYLQKFINFKISISGDEDTQPSNSFILEINVAVGLSFCLIVCSIIFLINLWNEARIIRQQFLRIGSYQMFQKEHNNFEGYGKYINISQQKQYLMNN